MLPYTLRPTSPPTPSPNTLPAAYTLRRVPESFIPTSPPAWPLLAETLPVAWASLIVPK